MKITNSEILSELASIVGRANVTNDLTDRICYSRDCGPDKGGIPELVVRPTSTNEVSKILTFTNKIQIPVFVWGRATDFNGTGIQRGSIVLDMSGMNRILQINENTMTVTAEAGAVWHSVASELRKKNLDLPVLGPGGLYSCTIGGSIAHNSVPHGMTGEGNTGENVLGLEVVLPTGSVIRTGSAANPNSEPFERYCLGPDLTGLFIGSSGMFGVLTKAVLRIKTIEESSSFQCYSFNSYKEALDAVLRLQKERATTFMVIVHGNLPTRSEALLHIIIQGRHSFVVEGRAIAEKVCEELGGETIDPLGTRRYWKEHMYSWLRLTPPKKWDIGRYWTEVGGYLSIPNILLCYHVYKKYVKDSETYLINHDLTLNGFDVYVSKNGGYLWIDILYDEQNRKSWNAALKIREEIISIFFDLGLCPCGLPAGISHFVAPKLGSTFTLLKQLKKTLDPNDILRCLT
jgi:hypothetical protein